MPNEFDPESDFLQEPNTKTDPKAGLIQEPESEFIQEPNTLDPGDDDE